MLDGFIELPKIGDKNCTFLLGKMNAKDTHPIEKYHRFQEIKIHKDVAIQNDMELHGK